MFILFHEKESKSPNQILSFSTSQIFNLIREKARTLSANPFDDTLTRSPHKFKINERKLLSVMI